MENLLRIIHTNQSEVADRIFQYDNILEMGAHQTFYKEEYGKELMDLLPNINWQRDKNNPYFKKFEEHIAIAVVVNAREKQILEIILSRSPTSFNSVSIFFRWDLFFSNSSTLSSLLCIFFKSLSGAEIHFFNNLPPIAVVVLSRIEISEPSRFPSCIE